MLKRFLQVFEHLAPQKRELVGEGDSVGCDKTDRTMRKRTKQTSQNGEVMK